VSRYLTDMAEVCRAAGLRVVEEPGWQTRARSSGGYTNGRPWCVMWHHTASNTTPANDVSYIINASDGPLANLYLARDGTVHVIAAGATNTNGKGGPLTFSRGTVAADSMNSAAIGVEAANSGIGQQWPQPQVDAYFALSNALTAAYGLLPTDISSHEHWSPGRKIDPATAPAVQGPWRPRGINTSGTWSVDDMRAECVARTAAPPPTPPQPTPPPEEDDMRISPFLIQGTGKDGSQAGVVYATDGQLMTLRAIPNEAALAGYRWTARTASPGIERQYPELVDGAPITPIDDLSAYGVIIA